MQSSNGLQDTEEANVVYESSQDILETSVDEGHTEENLQNDPETTSTTESIMKRIHQAIMIFNALASIGWVAGWYFLYQNVESFCKWSLKF